MKKLNETIKVKLEVETDNVNDVSEIQRILSLAGIGGSIESLIVPSDVITPICDMCGKTHEGSCDSEETDSVDFDHESFDNHMNRMELKTPKTEEFKNVNFDDVSYDSSTVDNKHSHSEVDETRGHEKEYDWGHRKYSSTGFTSYSAPEDIDFHGRGDMKVKMHGRGDNALYNVLVKEWQEFLKKQDAKEPKIGAAITTKSGITSDHIKQINAFLKQKRIGELKPHPKFGNKAIYIPSEIVDEEKISMILDKAIATMKDAVEERFGMQPFLDDWKIIHVFESADGPNEDMNKTQNYNNTTKCESEEELSSKSMFMVKKNYATFLKSMSDADLENECADQIFLSLHHADDEDCNAHWRLSMCQDEVQSRNSEIYRRAMAKARTITNEEAKILLTKN